jgi:hypothetical protein
MILTGKPNLWALIIFVIFFATGTAVENAQSAELGAEFSAAIGTSDNIARTSDSEKSEGIAVLGAKISFSDSSSRYDAMVLVDANYLDYLDDTFDSELQGGMVASLNTVLVENTLTWIFGNNFGQQPINPFEVVRPDNRENINYFTTGPDLRIPFGTRNYLGAELRYSDIYYEERPFDNNKTAATVSLNREMREGLTVALRASVKNVEYENEELSPDYDLVEYYVRVDNSSTRNELAVDLGSTEVEREGVKSDGLLARLEWTRQISSRSRLRMNGGVRYSDQGDIFRYLQDNVGEIGDTTDTDERGSPFRNTFAGMTYSFDLDRTTLGLTAIWNDEDYEDEALPDRQVIRYSVAFSRSFSRTMDFSARVSRSVLKYYSDNRQDEDDRAFLSLGYKLSPFFRIAVEYQFARRDSREEFGGFSENRAFLRVAYTPPWGQQ